MATKPRENDETVVLALGPTNTGKTHRAVTRMLEHASGMIGLPLRLLAREVYDRVSRVVGEEAVALVTGEEKRVPRAPRYWVCTVEAMPLDVRVDFLAVDEIQLAAHRERGHVFTDRLLHARGRRETQLLGADTMTPILRELLPHARVERQARLSALRHAGRSGLSGLPPRSAIVAFTAAEVYELAARMRAKKGGVAVVLGALSPRTRNAQVALYEAREVQYLVATDAIGMGLNLDVDHVAFASTEKFDGREHRPLEAAELGQIAGRAGRHMRDGTFGTLNPHPGLPEKLVARLEEHRFPAVKRLVYRSSALDFTSTDALAASLTAPAPGPLFVRVEQADDFDALRILAQRPEVKARAQGEDAVRLLWDVCQVPDYRKLLLSDHASLLETLFVMLVDHGHLDRAWVASEVKRVDRVEGEMDELTARLAAVRVWTYVVHQRAWIEGGLEARLREVEDRLGDALHARLVERFVERTSRPRTTRAEAASRPAGGAFSAQLGGLLEAQRRAAASARAAWVQAVVAAPHAAFTLGDDASVRYGDEVLGALVRGRELVSPGFVLADAIAVDRGERARLERRLVAFAKDVTGGLLARVASSGAEGIVRGVLWQLERGLGSLDAHRARAELASLGDMDREALTSRGIVLGARVVYARSTLSAEALRLRALLVRLFLGLDAPRAPGGATTLPRDTRVPQDAYLAAGFLTLGTRVMRVDIVERVLASLASLEEPFEVPAPVRASLGVKRAELPRIMALLGYRVDGSGFRAA